MEFNNFEIYPVGNAVLSTEGGVLEVSNISDSGLDGVMVNIENAPNAIINFDTLQSLIDNNGVLKSATLVKNSFGQVVPLLESFTWYNKKNDQVILGFNSGLLPKQYSVFGALNGVDVFSINGSDILSPDPNFPGSNPSYPEDPTPTDWVVPVVVAVIAVAGAVFSAVYSKTTTTTVKHYDANGKYTGCTVTTTHDPEPFDVMVNGNVYKVTDIGLRCDMILPNELIGWEAVNYNPVAEQITGCNLSNFTITSINPNN